MLVFGTFTELIEFLSAPIPYFCVAIVFTRSTPSISCSLSVLMDIPLSSVSSHIFKPIDIGRPISASWVVIINPLCKFLESITWIIFFSSSLRRISRATLSSSECVIRLLAPGVSITSIVLLDPTYIPLETSTVVPG